MSIAFAEKLPEALIKRLYASDRESGGAPAIQAGERDQALDWLRRALVEFDSLDQHFGLLQKLYASPFQYPRPRRDAWNLQQPVEAPSKSSFTHATELDDELVTAVLDKGVDCLSDDDLAQLLLNPFALFDLFDCIDDVQPDYWIDAIHDFLTVHRSSRDQSPAALPKTNGRGYSSPSIQQPAQDVSASDSVDVGRSLDTLLKLSAEISELLDRQKAARPRHEWRSTIALAAVLAFFMFSFAAFQANISSRHLQAIMAEQATLKELAQRIEKTRVDLDQLAQHADTHNLLIPTSDAQNRPVNWDILVQELYDSKLSDEENLKSLEAHGGDAVRQRIAQLRQRSPMPSSREMLDDLFRTWGGPALPKQQ